MSNLPSDPRYWLSSLRGLDPDVRGGDAPEIMLRRVWGFNEEQYRKHANQDNQDVVCLRPQDFTSAQDVQLHVLATVAGDLESLRQDQDGREFMRTAPEGLAYHVWIDNVRRNPNCPLATAPVYTFEQEQLADFAGTRGPGVSLLAKAWRDNATLMTVGQVCAPWFKKNPQAKAQMELF